MSQPEVSAGSGKVRHGPRSPEFRVFSHPPLCQLTGAPKAERPGEQRKLM